MATVRLQVHSKSRGTTGGGQTGDRHSFALRLATFDLREAAYQWREARGGFALLALVVAILHIAVAVVAGLALAWSTALTGTSSVT
jgi:hypothetical protein